MSKNITVLGILYTVEFIHGTIIAKIIDRDITFPDGYSRIEPEVMEEAFTKHIGYEVVSFEGTTINRDYLNNGLLCVAIHETDNLPLFAKYNDGWKIIAPWIEGE